ncbi:MAG: TIGR03000 domain-containing protein [Gemmataceae bacterium]|nr:TIGR03000 domain-containing protein [Gemmataceae bacterium]
MSPRPLALRCLLLAVLSLGLLQPAWTQDAKEKPCNLKVTMPHTKATLSIQGVATRQTGLERTFQSPPLDPSREYTYELTAFWEPNNYTKITRTKKVKVKGGQDVEVDMRKPDEGVKDDIKVRYVPTPNEVVDEMCKLGKVGKDDVVYDLGCGDGRMVIRAVKMFNAKKGIGVDFDPERVKDSKANAKREKVEDRVEIRQSDVLKIDDLSDATCILLYMGDDLNNALKPILLKTLKPGTRIVSHRFKMGDWKPDKSIVVKDSDSEEYDVHLWIIPEKGKEPEKEKE